MSELRVSVEETGGQTNAAAWRKPKAKQFSGAMIHHSHAE